MEDSIKQLQWSTRAIKVAQWKIHHLEVDIKYNNQQHATEMIERTRERDYQAELLKSTTLEKSKLSRAV